ncbi:carbohydrate-binding module family 13 protein [Collybiopsis luxurians FD-317 M1]|nr:carbohydrate-binding module family 13 protein [Collybiopsis luxurians FD-317 M1]
MSVRSGCTYILVNGKAESSVLDLSGTDGKNIIGWNDNGGDNQKWHLEQVEGEHWTFRNRATGKYLGFEGPPRDGTPLVGVDYPVEWDIYPDNNDRNLHRVYVPRAPTAMNIDLSDHGNPNNGTPVTLWGKWEGKNQTWNFVQV